MRELEPRQLHRLDGAAGDSDPLTRDLRGSVKTRQAHRVSRAAMRFNSFRRSTTVRLPSAALFAIARA